MKFGLLYITDYDPKIHGSTKQFYDDILEEIEYADALGFEGVFIAEHYVGGYAFPSPHLLALAAAERTKRIRLGTGVALLPLCQPIQTAEQYAMLDVLTGGRIDFGVGRGILKAEYELFGVNEAESHERYLEALEVILKAWTQEEVHHEGKHYQVSGLKALPKPLQKPTIPIWAACAVTPTSFSWAGERGFNPMICPFAFPNREDLMSLMDLYWESYKKAEHEQEDPDVLGVYHLYMGDSDEEAGRLGKDAFLRYWDFFTQLDQKAAFGTDAYKNYQGGGLSNIFKETPWDVIDKSDCVMFGNPDRLIQRLERARTDYGITYPIFEVNFGGISHKEAMRNLETFASKVMPHFQ